VRASFADEWVKFDLSELQSDRREKGDAWAKKSEELRQAIEAERIAHGVFKSAEMKCDRWNEWGMRMSKLDSDHLELFD
jgi:hypothetical protein